MMRQQKWWHLLYPIVAPRFSVTTHQYLLNATHLLPHQRTYLKYHQLGPTSHAPSLHTTTKGPSMVFLAASSASPTRLTSFHSTSYLGAIQNPKQKEKNDPREFPQYRNWKVQPAQVSTYCFILTLYYSNLPKIGIGKPSYFHFKVSATTDTNHPPKNAEVKIQTIIRGIFLLIALSDNGAIGCWFLYRFCSEAKRFEIRILEFQRLWI